MKNIVDCHLSVGKYDLKECDKLGQKNDMSESFATLILIGGWDGVQVATHTRTRYCYLTSHTVQVKSVTIRGQLGTKPLLITAEGQQIATVHDEAKSLHRLAARAQILQWQLDKEGEASCSDVGEARMRARLQGDSPQPE